MSGGGKRLRCSHHWEHPQTLICDESPAHCALRDTVDCPRKALAENLWQNAVHTHTTGSGPHATPLEFIGHCHLLASSSLSTGEYQLGYPLRGLSR